MYFVIHDTSSYFVKFSNLVVKENGIVDLFVEILNGGDKTLFNVKVPEGVSKSVMPRPIKGFQSNWPVTKENRSIVVLKYLFHYSLRQSSFLI